MISSMIQPMISGMVSGVTSGSTGTPTELLDYFASNGTAFPYNGGATGPVAIYVASTNKTIIGYVGIERNATIQKLYVIEYNHSTQRWSQPTVAMTSGIYGDDHDIPALCRDHEGYIHVFGGTHNGGMRHSVSSAPDSISSFGAYEIITAMSQDTYPHPAAVGNKIYLFTRRLVPADDRYRLNMQTGTCSGGVVTWGGTSPEVGNMGTDSRWYQGDHAVVGTDIHMCATRANYADTYRRNVYHLIYDTLTGSIKNIQGTRTIASGSFPVTLADLDADFRVHDHGVTDGGIVRMQMIGSIPHFLFKAGTSPVFDINHCYWNGSIWTTPTVVATMPAGAFFNDGTALVKRSTGELDAYYVNDTSALWTRGGDIKRVTRSAGGTWGAASTIATATRFGFDVPDYIENGLDELNMVYSECFSNVANPPGIIHIFARGIDSAKQRDWPVKQDMTSAAQLISRMTTAPDAPRTALITGLFDSIYPLRSKINGFWVFAGHARDAAYLNWMSENFDANFVNPAAFAADVGFLPNNNFTAMTDWDFTNQSLYTTSSAHMGVYLTTTTTTLGRSDLAINRAGAAANYNNYIQGDVGVGKINNTAVGAAGATAVGHHVVVQDALASFRMYKNGSQIAVSTTPASPAGAPLGPLQIGGNGSSRTDRRIGAAHIGSALTAGEVATLNTAINTYLTAIGAV